MEWVTRRGDPVPPLGQGTWKMGEGLERAREVKVLQAGIDRGLTLIDTAEMYADGGAERVVGEAVAGRRDEVFITTKVWPTHATRAGVVASVAASLKRLGTDAVDLTLLHWPSRDHPLEETVAGLLDCQTRGLTRHIGVSNFPRDLLREARRLCDKIAVDQVEYSLTARHAERTLIPYAIAEQVALMAYSPLRHLVGAGASAAGRRALAEVAARHGVSPEAVALAFVLRPEAGPMVTIPKTARVEHLDQNRAALALRLSPEDTALLAQAFPQPAQDLEIERF